MGDYRGHKLIESNGLEAPDHARTLGLLQLPKCCSDARCGAHFGQAIDFGARGAETRVANRSGSSRKVLNAKHVSDTNSGHAIRWSSRNW
jgi:hypothetical protein